MYVLNLAEDKRILSAGKVVVAQNYEDKVIAKELPDTSDGKWVTDYYYIDGEYVYDPEPREEQ